MIYNRYLDKVGDLPIVKLDLDIPSNINLYAKLEFLNPLGSVKDRAAKYIIETLLKNKEIDQDTILIESSSGNFGIALASRCREYGLKFYCVIDSHSLEINELIINALSTKVFKVTELDRNGGYLLNRIKKVKELTQEIPNSYWVNQYGNPYNARAYYETLGKEICDDFDQIDYVFIGVSSGGTITGISQRVKETFPDAKIVAVDIDGSVVFGGKPKKRYIPGIGSSMVPDIISEAKIDEVFTVDEVSSLEMCYEILCRNSILAGGSSGSVAAAVKRYFGLHKVEKEITVVMIFPDHGERYSNTIYNPEWCKRLK